MQKTYEVYAKQGFTILAVNTTYQDEQTAALQFAAQHDLTFPFCSTWMAVFRGLTGFNPCPLVLY